MLNQTFHLGQFWNLKIMAKGTAVVGALLGWLVWTLVWHFALGWGWATAVTLGFFAGILHLLSELWHHLGHSIAARHAGWPMSGILFFWVLAVSLYPPNEPTLPARIHIQRALGGPIGSFSLALVAGILVLLTAGHLKALCIFLFVDNLAVFSLGALLPLPILDGGTLLRYWGQK